MVTKGFHAHFKKSDPILFSVFKSVDIEPISSRDPKLYFVSLCHSIIGQQLSNTVADVISERFTRLFMGSVTPDALLAIEDGTYRNIGMSFSKIRYIKDLAAKVKDRTVDLSALSRETDEDVIARLTVVKGVGRWTAEMFLMFTLGRPDVFSFGDLGLKRAIQKLYGFKTEPSVRTMERLSRKWRPYRTYAALALWKYKDG